MSSWTSTVEVFRLCCRFWKCILMCALRSECSQITTSSGSDSFSFRRHWWRGGVGAQRRVDGCHVCSPCAFVQSCRAADFSKKVTGQRRCVHACLLFSVGACLWVHLSGWCVHVGEMVGVYRRDVFMVLKKKLFPLQGFRLREKNEETFLVWTGCATITLLTPALLFSFSLSFPFLYNFTLT